LRICATGATEVGLVAVGLTGNSSLEVSVGEIGEVTGVEEAMVPPTPVRDKTGLILSGAFLVIAHDVGGMLTTGVTRAGLCGEPMAMTNGMLEFDAALNLRSGGDAS
jgi:hypothetical protein